MPGTIYVTLCTDILRHPWYWWAWHLILYVMCRSFIFTEIKYSYHITFMIDVIKRLLSVIVNFAYCWISSLSHLPVYQKIPDTFLRIPFYLFIQFSLCLFFIDLVFNLCYDVIGLYFLSANLEIKPAVEICLN